MNIKTELGILTLLATLLLSSASHADFIFDQSPNLNSVAAYGSPLGPTEALSDNFVLQDNSIVGIFRFWGRPESDDVSGLRVSIYEDNGGLPGATLRQETFSLNELTITNSGVDDGFNELQLYVGSFTTPIDLAANTPYYFGVAGEGNPWLWGGQDTFGDHFRLFGGAWQRREAATQNFNLAFALTAVPEPSYLLPTVLVFCFAGRRRHD